MNVHKLLGLLLGVWMFSACGADVSSVDPDQSKQTIEQARISPLGDQVLVEGISDGQPVSVVTDSVLVEAESGEFVEWSAGAIEKEKECYYCEKENGRTRCWRIACL